VSLAENVFGLEGASTSEPWYHDLEQVIGALNCGLAARNADDRLVFANDRLLRWLGYERAEFEGRALDDLFPPENVALLRAELAAIDEGDLRARLTVLRRKDGTALPAIVLPQPVRDAEGRSLGGIAVIVELATVQTALPAGYAASQTDLRSRLERIALELQSLGLAAGLSRAVPVPFEHAELSGLSEREREVLAQLVSGERVADIAGQLHISQHTVRNHLKSIYRKVGVQSQSALIHKVRSLSAPAGD
jgi:PAS domain S-box-containing protein